jgi:putative redox protein
VKHSTVLAVILRFYLFFYWRTYMADCGGSCAINNSEDGVAIKELQITVGKESILSEVKQGKHTFYVDETSVWGGKDSSPDPWDYILGGLGGCIAISLRQYATKHSLKLEKAEITLSYTYDENAGNSPYKVDKSIKLVGDLTVEEREQLFIISNSPAQKMLTKGMDITSSLVLS